MSIDPGVFIVAFGGAFLVFMFFRTFRHPLYFTVGAMIGGVGKLPAEGVLLWGLIGLGVGCAWYAWKNRGSDDHGPAHLRGAAFAPLQKVQNMLKNTPSRFNIGGVPIPIELETRGFLLAGSPGTGKSIALTSALDALRVAKARAVIADASGIYCGRYYEDEDIIINPFDARCAPWSPLAEITGLADVPTIAKALIPDAEGEAKEWNSYAQTFCEAILEYAYENELKNSDIYELMVVSKLERLREVCAGSAAAALVEEGNEKMFGSVRAIAATYTKFLRYLPDVGAEGFSVRRHIATERGGWIFLTYNQEHRDGLQGLIGCVMDVAARAVLALPPDLNRRVVFALDEMPLLGKISSLVDLATNGRKHGAVIFGGLQTIAQLREKYGRETAQTLLACLGSWLVLRCSDAETAEYMSRYLGEEQIRRVTKSGGTSDGREGSSSHSNWSEQIAHERIVLPAQLQNLNDRVGYFNLAGPVPVTQVYLDIPHEQRVATNFVPADLNGNKKRKREEFSGLSGTVPPEQSPEQSAETIEDVF